MPTYKMTPQKFKQIRKELNLTQKQLAKELGLEGDRHIRYIESGQRELKGVLLKCFEYYCEINQPKQQSDKR
jgi:transcriptional regulator with XRE-family HTH domain